MEECVSIIESLIVSNAEDELSNIRSKGFPLELAQR